MKKLTPGRYPVQKICPPKKRRHYFVEGFCLFRKAGSYYFAPPGDAYEYCYIWPKIIF